MRRFDLVGLKRRFERLIPAPRRPTPEGGPLVEDRDRVRLLAITRGRDEEVSLREIGARLDWSVSIVGSLAEAIERLRQEPMPLVICDRDLPGEDWRATVAQIAARRDVLCVVLASTVVDDYLWDEVIKQRGYDVVNKPFEADQLKRAVTFARSWNRANKAPLAASTQRPRPERARRRE